MRGRAGPGAPRAAYPSAVVIFAETEFATFAPLIILAVWIGLYPSPFLVRIETSVNRVIARVNTTYPQNAGATPDCDTPLTASAAAATPEAVAAAQFLQAVPCADPPASGAPQRQD